MGWEGLNRRSFPRAKFPCLLKVIQRNGQETILTHTENISSGGVCVIIKKHLEMFETVEMELDLMDGGEVFSCKSRVVWTVRRKATESVKPSQNDIGFEFLDIREQDRKRVERLVDHLVKAFRVEP